jgi:hypothetical protein
MKKVPAQEKQDIVLAGRHNHGLTLKEGAGMSTTGFINDVNPKAMRHLMKSFQNAANIEWQIDEEDITADFTQDDERIKVRYDKNGYHLSTRKIYPGNKLEPFIAVMVRKEVDKNFGIYLVIELINGGKKDYEIILQNQQYWCLVRITQSKEGLLEKSAETKIYLKG